MGEQEHVLTPEQLAELIRQMRVSDVLVSAVATVGQLAYSKLDPQSRDLDEAKLAIEALRALTPVLEGRVSVETMRDFNQLVANLQLAYVSATSAPATPEGEPPGEADAKAREGADEPQPEAPPPPSAEVTEPPPAE